MHISILLIVDGEALHWLKSEPQLEGPTYAPLVHNNILGRHRRHNRKSRSQLS
jgi:hypothetical protein